MQRLVATLPESVKELCLVRVGFQVRKWSAYRTVLNLLKSIDTASGVAIQAGEGLLHSERFMLGFRRFGVLQYWSSYEALEAWSHRPPHSEWWKLAVERSRIKGDLGIYHESFLVPRLNVESIFMNCEPVGLAAFCPLEDAIGPRTTSRDRLGRRRTQEG